MNCIMCSNEATGGDDGNGLNVNGNEVQYRSLELGTESTELALKSIGSDLQFMS